MKKKIIVFVVFVLLVIIKVNAQWQQTNGPFGGNISCFAELGNTIFSGTINNGLFKSNDNGNTWTTANNGITVPFINDIIVKGNKIFVSSISCGGVFVSSDTGVSWNQIINGFSNCPWVYSLAISGNNIFAGTSNGIYLTTNDGVSWSQMNTGLSLVNTRLIAACGSVIFAYTDGGLYKSTNNGTNWTSISNSFPNTYIRKLVTYGTDIYACTNNGIAKSSNYGSNWSFINNGLTDTNVITLTINGNNLYAGTYSGIFTSSNNGISWNSANIGLNGNGSLAILVSGTNVFSGSMGDGIFKSTNNCGSWYISNKGLTGLFITSLIAKNSYLYAACNEGFFISNDYGQNWNKVSQYGFKTLAVDGSDIYALDNMHLYKSANNGFNWATICSGINSDSIFYGLAVNGSKIYLSGQNGLYFSNNSGLNWTNINYQVSYPFSSSIYLIDTAIYFKKQNGTFCSFNNGVNWNTVNSGYSNTFLDPFIKFGSDIIAGSKTHGAFLSTNNGNSWINATSGITDTLITSLAVFGSKIFASTKNKGVFISTDTCASWTPMNIGLQNLVINNLSVCDSFLFANIFNGVGYEIWKYPLSYAPNLSLDAGVIEIITPINPIQVGDTYTLKVIIKNFGTQNLSSFQIGFKINGLTYSPMNWIGGLAHNDTDTVILGQFIVNNSNSINLVAYTNLNGDMNHFNDTCYKTLTFTYDAGVTDIILPSIITIGDSIYPVVKFKNYGSQTISNIHLIYKVNGQIIANEVWTGNLIHDSSSFFTFSQKYIINTTNPLQLLAYTNLLSDLSGSNDQDSIIITANPALNDVGIIAILNPTDIACNATLSPVRVIIKNFGINPRTSVPLSYQRGTQTPVTGTWTGTALNYGDTAYYTFAPLLNLGSGVSILLSAYTSLSNDYNVFNNKYSKMVNISNYPVTISSISGDDTVIVGQTNIHYKTIQSIPIYYQYIWTLPPGANIDSAYENNIVVNYGMNAQSGNISCKILNACGASNTMILPVQVFLTPQAPIIYQNGNTLYSGYSNGNQWYFNNTAIPGATLSSYIPTNTGSYFCKVTINGTTSLESNTIHIFFTGIEDEFIKSHFNLYPNPVSEKTTFTYSINTTSDIELKIIDTEGRLIKTIIKEVQTTGSYDKEFDASGLSRGIYFYRFIANNTMINGKLIITK